MVIGQFCASPATTASGGSRLAQILRPRPRRGLILIVVLVMIALLSLLAAGYTFMVRSHLHSVMAQQERFSARMAAESGVQRAIALLRKSKNDPAVWYDNPALFKGWLVYGEDKKEADLNRTENTNRYDPAAAPAWRYNLVAPNYDRPGTLRYGLTDECSKLNLNTATERQLHRLLAAAIPQDPIHPVDVNVLVDSLLDWREPGDTPRPNGAKNAYYQSQRPPYRSKGGPFSTIEELLLVRGFTGGILFGEDYNRNGLLDPNEDDANASFPPDNGDGQLFAGIAPYLTLWSRETNTSSDGRRRIDLNMKDTQKLQELLAEQIPPQIAAYILSIRAQGITFNSVMNLIPAPPPPPKEEKPAGEGDEPASQPADEAPPISQPASQPGGRIRSRKARGLSDLDGSEKDTRPPIPVYSNLTAEPPPGTYADLPVLLDRLTASPQPQFAGRIDISTAPRAVLLTLEELSEADVDAILAARATIKPEERTTPAWVLQYQALDEGRFRQVLPKITTGSSVFTIEAVGYGDHTGVIERILTIIEMRGPVPQVLYSRNLAGLGPAYTPHGVDERVAPKGLN